MLTQLDAKERPWNNNRGFKGTTEHSYQTKRHLSNLQILLQFFAWRTENATCHKDKELSRQEKGCNDAYCRIGYLQQIVSFVSIVTGLVDKQRFVKIRNVFNSRSKQGIMSFNTDGIDVFDLSFILYHIPVLTIFSIDLERFPKTSPKISTEYSVSSVRSATATLRSSPAITSSLGSAVPSGWATIITKVSMASSSAVQFNLKLWEETSETSRLCTSGSASVWKGKVSFSTFVVKMRFDICVKKEKESCNKQCTIFFGEKRKKFEKADKGNKGE